MKILAGDLDGTICSVKPQQKQREIYKKLLKNPLASSKDIGYKPGNQIEIFGSNGKTVIKPYQISSIDIVTEDNKKSVLAKAGWGTVGLAALGPLGLLAGVFGGGNRSQRVVSLVLKDGRKALISGKSKEVQELLVMGY